MVIELAAITSVGALLGATTTNVLVDSGADLTMLNADLASDLGLDTTTMTEGTVAGVGGETTCYMPDAAITPVLANLCGRWTPVPVCFEVGRDINLLGRAGAFEAMLVAFSHKHTLMLAAPN
jgi:hypothetical protein